MKQKKSVRRIGTDIGFPNTVYPQKPFDFRKAGEDELWRAEIDDFRWHDLRHSAGSYLAMSEVYHVNSNSYENLLSTINYKAFGKIIANKLYSEAVQHFEGFIRLCGKIHDVGFRAMGDKPSIEIDISDEEWHSVLIKQCGWEVDKYQNYLFRSKSIKSLLFLEMVMMSRNGQLN